MIRWALTFVLNRLIFMGLFLLALNAYTQSSTSCHYGSPRSLMPVLAGLPEAFKTLTHAFR